MKLLFFLFILSIYGESYGRGDIKKVNWISRHVVGFVVLLSFVLRTNKRDKLSMLKYFLERDVNRGRNETFFHESQSLIISWKCSFISVSLSLRQYYIYRRERSFAFASATAQLPFFIGMKMNSVEIRDIFLKCWYDKLRSNKMLCGWCIKCLHTMYENLRTLSSEPSNITKFKLTFLLFLFISFHNNSYGIS